MITHLEKEVCENGVEKDGPEDPAASAEEAGEEGDDDAVCGAVGLLGEGGEVRDMYVEKGAVRGEGVGVVSERKQGRRGESATHPTNLYPSYAIKSTTAPSSPIPKR